METGTASWDRQFSTLLADASNVAEPAADRALAGHCLNCRISLGMDHNDDPRTLPGALCADCKATLSPSARRALSGAQAGSAASIDKNGSARSSRTSRSFTAADSWLIAKSHSFMQPEMLLGILNDRLCLDRGGECAPYTMEQLHKAIAVLTPEVPEDGTGQDWPSIRRVLGQARRSGLLATVTEQLVLDFAVVFQLNARQIMTLKDIVLGEGDGE